MKRIILIWTLILSIFILWLSYSPSALWNAGCNFDPDYNENGDTTTVANALNDCFENTDKTKLVTTAWVNDGASLDIADGFKKKINSWVQTLGSILAILAVGSIVYWSFLLVISGWEEEKLKKWKDVVKWGIVWFLWVVFASALIAIVVNIMFSI